MQVPLRVLQQVVIGGREGALVSVQGEGLFPDVALNKTQNVST